MNFTERFNLLINELSERGIKQINIAEVAGLSRSQVTSLKDGRLKSINIEPALLIEKEYGYRHEWLMVGTLPKLVTDKITNEIIPDDRWQAVKLVNLKLSAGVTGFAVDYLDGDEFEPLFFKKSWFERKKFNPSKLYALLVKGQSMSPTIEEGAIVIINTEDTSIKDNEIYAVNHQGELVIKRISFDFGKYWLVSDNQDNSRFPRVLCDSETKVIGKVVYYQCEM